MNTALLNRLEAARWSGNNQVSIKVTELDAMVAEVIQLRQELIQLRRDDLFNDDEKLFGFVKLEAIQEMRQGKTPSCRILRWKRTPYFVVPVYLKLTAVENVLKWKDPSKK